MHTEIGKKIVVDENSDTQSSLLSPNHLFADVCVGLLNQGQGVRFRANGWSMYPTICDGEMINVEPVLPSQVRHGDIILYRCPRGITAHRVIHIQKEMNSALSPHCSSLVFHTRGDSLRADDSPVMSDQILGKVFSVERNGRTVALYGIRAIMLQKTRLFLFRLKQYVVSMLSKYRGFLFGGYLPAK
jgi:signal peptidase I